MYPSGAKLPDGYYIYSLINNSDMSTIAKGMITLTAVSDAYSVLLSPSSCAVNAALDGSNPDLSNAKTRIQAYRGDVKMPFTMSLFRKSDINITYTITNNVDDSKLVELTAIPNNISSGSLEFTITVGQEYQTIITFQFTVIRESSMLDWVQDWNGRKTSIGGESIVTPKLFVGRKNENNTLDGVYIGPSNVNFGASYYGMYGYKASQEIFHINENGGSIGGWSIESNGIISPHGSLKLLASNQGASIVSHDSNLNVVWGIYSNGEASFAAGNVLFHSDGSASFAGSITAIGGTIGGFSINSYGIYSSDYRVVIDSYNKYIGISKTSDASNIPNGSTNTHKNRIISNGGVYLHYNTDSDYGLVGYLPRVVNGSNYTLQKIFSIGSTNFIAGWSFDDTSLWIGAKANIKNTYANSGEITIGTNGLRGEHWYIDSDGGVSFLSGLVSFEPSGGAISGWLILQNRLGCNNIAIISEDSADCSAGVYICNNNISSLSNSQLLSNIQTNGGIYMIYRDDPEFAGYKGQNCVFKLRSSSACQISSWNFDDAALYLGTKNNTANSFTSVSGSITIGSNGIRGNAWRLESDGSGSLAGGNIAWGADGSLFVSVVDTLKSDLVSAGINVTAGTIDLIANKTRFLNPNGTQIASFTDDGLQSNKVQCLDNNGNKRLEVDYNGVKMYYPLQNGQTEPQIMKEEIFNYDNNGNVIGTETRYYNLDGTIKWRLDSAGNLSSSALSEYWNVYQSYIIDNVQMQQIFTSAKNNKELSYEWTRTTEKILNSSISIFRSFDGDHSSYNGKVASGAIDPGVAPNDSTNWLTGWRMNPLNAYQLNNNDNGKYVRKFQHYNNGTLGACAMQSSNSTEYVTEILIEFNIDSQTVAGISYSVVNIPDPI